MNIVKSIADEDEIIYNQHCKYACEVEGHKVYCENYEWKNKPRKCSYCSFYNGEDLTKKCEGYTPKESE